MESLQQRIRRDFEMNVKQGSELENKILQANQQIVDLQRTLKDKKENIKNLKDKNQFLQDTT